MLGGPTVALLLRHRTDPWVVQVTPDHHPRILFGIRQHRVQLVATRRRRQPRHGAQVKGIHPHQRSTYPNRGHGRRSLAVDETGEMRQQNLSVFYDRPACQYRITEVPVGVEAVDRGVVHVPHAECVGYPSGAFLIHLLQQDHIRVSEGWIVRKHRDGAVHPDPILDVERDDPQRGGVLLWGGNSPATRVTRAPRIGVVPSSCAPHQTSKEKYRIGYGVLSWNTCLPVGDYFECVTGRIEAPAPR